MSFLHQVIVDGKKKKHKAKLEGFEQKKYLTQLFYGSVGLKVLESGRVTPKQFEAVRRGLTRFIKKKTAQLWFRQTPNYALSKKPTEIRMGKGKGGVVLHVARIRAGSIFCEIDGLPHELAVQLLLVVATKLGVQTKLIRSRRYF